MKRLWAPWRMRYVSAPKEEGCILCKKPNEGKDAENYIVYRGGKCFVLLNTFPYNNGHVMVSPYRHVERLGDLDEDERKELLDLIDLSIKSLDASMKPEGYNIGINIGKAAGAGLAHLHIHIVPRWVGDTNFMPILAETKVLPQLLTETYSTLIEAYRNAREAPK